jgi:hypothetical protein
MGDSITEGTVQSLVKSKLSIQSSILLLLTVLIMINI